MRYVRRTKTTDADLSMEKYFHECVRPCCSCDLIAEMKVRPSWGAFLSMSFFDCKVSGMKNMILAPIGIRTKAIKSGAHGEPVSISLDAMTGPTRLPRRYANDMRKKADALMR
jgi:hypothetical protein